MGYANIGGIAGNRGLLQCGSWWNSPIIAIKRDSLNVRSALFVFALFPASAPSAVDCDLFVGRMPLMKDIDRLPPLPPDLLESEGWRRTGVKIFEFKAVRGKILETNRFCMRDIVFHLRAIHLLSCISVSEVKRIAEKKRGAVLKWERTEPVSFHYSPVLGTRVPTFKKKRSSHL